MDVRSLVQVTSKFTGLSLTIPLLDPVNWAQCGVGLEEHLAWLKVLTLGVDTLVVVHV